MKKYVVFIVYGVLLISCSKNNSTPPYTPPGTTGNVDSTPPQYGTPFGWCA